MAHPAAKSGARASGALPSTPPPVSSPSPSEVHDLDSSLTSELARVLPPGLLPLVNRDVTRLRGLAPTDHEHQRVGTYLELVAHLPWSTSTDGELDLKACAAALDASHCGLADVKEEILEHLAVARRNPERRPPILALIGPPGVGKTSLATTLAQCLGRPVEWINLAALHGQGQLTGCSRSQGNGAPGKLIEAFLKARVNDPVIVIEELDHVDWSRRDHPGAALFELLDPRLDYFVDAYVGLPFPTDKAWFVVTANSLDGVPRKIRDRFEVIAIRGYTEEEKLSIAERFLLPQTLAAAGLTKEQCAIGRDVMALIIRRHTHEAGVRQLRRRLEKIVRKTAKMLDESISDAALPAPAPVTATTLSEFMGGDGYLEEEEIRKTLPPGVATGVVWTEAGGEVVYVETVRMPQSHGLVLTGRMGKVMRESAEAALSYLWSRGRDLKLPRDAFTKAGIHVHIPAASIAKDGPSAGVTILTALASLLLDKAVKPDIAFTGEITLTGLVLGVGGVKEKALAALRAGLKTFVLPRQNDGDLAFMPPELLSAMQFILIDKVDDVLAMAFVDAKADAQPEKGPSHEHHGQQHQQPREPTPAIHSDRSAPS